MPTKHLPIGGSTASRTLACPGWINASEGVPKGKSSVYADEGNLLHDAMEDYYQNGVQFSDQLGRKYADQVLTEDLIDDYLVPAREMVEQVLDTYDIEEFICEPFVEYIPDVAGGSIDMLGVSHDKRTVVVLDYKFGHAPVNPKTSAQLPFYALAASVDPATETFFDQAEYLVYVIIQPKVSHEPQIHEEPYESLGKFMMKLDAAIKLTQQKNLPKVVGKHCQYCPAAPYCDEKKAQVRSALLINSKNAENLTESLQLAEQLESWVKEVNAHAHNLMEQGAQVPGYKLVEKRALRKWKDASQVRTALYGTLGDALYKKELITPAQAEKIIKKEKLNADIDQLIEKKSSGTTVVPISDKREAVTIPEISDSLKRIAEGNT